jgi:hypothetical protein
MHLNTDWKDWLLLGLLLYIYFAAEITIGKAHKKPYAFLFDKG